MTTPDTAAIQISASRLWPIVALASAPILANLMIEHVGFDCRPCQLPVAKGVWTAYGVHVARKFKDTDTCPERMARRSDAVQCPISWVRRHEQIDLFRRTA